MDTSNTPEKNIEQKITAQFLTKKFLLTLVVAVLMVGSFFVGSITQAEKTYSQTTGLATSTDFNLFWKVWSTLDSKFSPAKNASSTLDKDKVYGSIKGLVDSYGDPYTQFFAPKEAKTLAQDLSGQFTGVGMIVDVAADKSLVVTSPIKGSPAELAGIRTGDKILFIDDVDVSTLNQNQAVEKIRGPVGTPVTITLMHAGQTTFYKVTVIRKVIDFPVIETEQLQNGIFEIKFYEFTDNSAKLFQNALREFVKSGNNKLIIDLRGNPGGYLDAAVDIGSWFLPQGKIIVKEDFGSKADPIYYRSKGYNLFTDKLKIVILVDKGSASASEILAGALREHGVAQLVGVTTFGKGSVQELINFNDGATLKVTVAHWFTPLGVSISKQGLTPDYEVKFTDEDIKLKRDAQLEKAKEVLLK